MFESGLLLLLDWRDYISFQAFHSSPTLGFLHSDAESIPTSEIPDINVGWDTRTSLTNRKLLADLISGSK